MTDQTAQLPFSLADRQHRLHVNRQTAMVARYRDGGRWLAVVLDPVGFVRLGASRDHRDDAQVLADALAHPNCDGVGCGTWAEAPPFTEIRIVPRRDDGL